MLHMTYCSESVQSIKKKLCELKVRRGKKNKKKQKYRIVCVTQTEMI